MTGVKRNWPEEIQNFAILHRVFIILYYTLFLFFLNPCFGFFQSTFHLPRTKSKSRTFEKYCRELRTTELQAYFSSAKLQTSIRFITIF